MSRRAGNHQPNGAGKDVAPTAMSRFPDPANGTQSTAQNVAKRERKSNGNGQVKPEYSRDISDMLRAANEQLLKRRADNVGRVVGSAFGWLAPLADLPQTSEIESPAETVSKPPTRVRLFPMLMNGISRAGMDAAGRVWLTLRHIDESGRGWLDIDDVRDKLTSKTSMYRVCGQRRLRQILNDGEGQLWERDQHGKLWIYGTVRACLNFGIERLSGDNIEVDFVTIIGSIKTYRATMYGAFLASKRTAPISREKITEATGYSERSQREFDQIIGTKITRNFSIDAQQTDETKEAHLWQCGRAHFEFYDGHGKQGEKGRTYNARRLPNTYETQFQRGTNGRKKKINRKLKTDLVATWEQGNGTDAQLRVFHTDALTAGKATKSAQTAILRHYSCRDFATWTTYEGEAMHRGIAS